ncbi:ATP-binding protein [Leifsonia sp. NPDC058292]|uniref:ATP-binding protein n=1 Tax=Leifsonia sp. NPDC058292 TaxID=3346428 RepID=UPI0036DC9BE0
MVAADQTLLELRAGLYSHLAPTPEFKLPPIDEFEDWDDKAKAEFNHQRIVRLGRDLTITTPSMVKLHRELLLTSVLNEERARGRSGFVINGLPTRGKTTLCLEAMRFFYTAYRRQRDGVDLADALPIVYICLPAHITPKAVIERASRFIGLPEGSYTLESLQARVVNNMVTHGTRLVVVDEIQNLTTRSFVGIESSRVLKDLIEQTYGCTFILAGSDAGQSAVMLGDLGFPVLARSQLIELTDYNADASGVTEWHQALSSFERRLGLFGQEPGTLLELSRAIFKRTNGRISAVNELLRRAAAQVIHSSTSPQSEVITQEVLDQTFLDAKSPNQGRP